MSLAKGARNRGVKMAEGVQVLGVMTERRAGAEQVTGVRVLQGGAEHTIHCEVLVNCAGQWARQFGALAGVNVPLYSAEHFYIVTGKIDGVHPMLPVMRDPDGFIVVAMMTADGAASRDGRIQAGDRIMAVAPSERSIFVDTKDLDNETVTRLLRGRVGTVVRMKLTDSLGANPRVIDLTRARIQVAGREILDAALEAHVRLARAPEPEGEWPADFPAFVVLRSGDVAPCRIESIDAESVILRTPLAGGADAGTTRVPATLVKAVELIPAVLKRRGLRHLDQIGRAHV